LTRRSLQVLELPVDALDNSRELLLPARYGLAQI